MAEVGRHERSVPVKTPSRGYEVLIGLGILDSLGSRMAQLTDSRTVVLMSDATVNALYGDAARASLAHAGFAVTDVIVPPGEPSKNWGRAGEVLEMMAAAGLARADVAVALGGGVVGDLAGFCAATYMRGIDFVQVPTTLLAQVDSSVGGKTGVDLRAGKNLAGAFHQPLLVLADTSVLSTLLEEDWASGLAETYKMAVLEGEDRLSGIERDAAALLARDPQAVSAAVSAAVSFKASVVARDERESGVRECLNLGHTLGHAIEKVLGYGAVPHGIAVAEGTRFAAELAAMGDTESRPFADRIASGLDSLGLRALGDVFDPQAIKSALYADKKVRDGRVRWVIPTAPGRWNVTAIEQDVLDRALGVWATGRSLRG